MEEYQNLLLNNQWVTFAWLVPVLISLCALKYSKGAKKIAKQANKIAEDANRLSSDSNLLTRYEKLVLRKIKFVSELMSYKVYMSSLRDDFIAIMGRRRALMQRYEQVVADLPDAGYEDADGLSEWWVNAANSFDDVHSEGGESLDAFGETLSRLEASLYNSKSMPRYSAEVLRDVDMISLESETDEIEFSFKQAEGLGLSIRCYIDKECKIIDELELGMQRREQRIAGYLVEKEKEESAHSSNCN